MTSSRFALLLAIILLGQDDSRAEEAIARSSEDALPNVTARTGEFNVSFTIGELLGPAATRYETIIPVDEPLAWQMYVPESYSHQRPAGIMVYISPKQTAKIPRQWKPLMAEHNLIWIGANDSGNRVPVPRRMAFALTAPAVVDRDYETDAGRVYLTGFSGGGRVASMVAAEFPSLFRGAIFNCGAVFWRTETPDGLDQIRNNHYVFVTGTYDQALEPTKKAFRAYREAGVDNSKLMIIRNMAHRNPKWRDFDKAIRFLDMKSLE